MEDRGNPGRLEVKKENNKKEWTYAERCINAKLSHYYMAIRPEILSSWNFNRHRSQINTENIGKGNNHPEIKIKKV